MSEMVIMAGGLFLLAILSGMLGLGVAFAAVPFLSLFLHDLVHQVQPLTLILNGLTALFAKVDEDGVDFRSFVNTRKRRPVKPPGYERALGADASSIPNSFAAQDTLYRETVTVCYIYPYLIWKSANFLIAAMVAHQSGRSILEVANPYPD